MQFVLKIELGNDAMRTSADLLVALAEVRRQVAEEFPGLHRAQVNKIAGRSIKDMNGNSVGSWEVNRDDEGKQHGGRI